MYNLFWSFQKNVYTKVTFSSPWIFRQPSCSRFGWIVESRPQSYYQLSYFSPMKRPKFNHFLDVGIYSSLANVYFIEKKHAWSFGTIDQYSCCGKSRNNWGGGGGGGYHETSFSFMISEKLEA